PGTAYLRRRRAQLSAHERARNAAAMGAEAVHKALSTISEAARRHPPQDERLRGDPSWMILNGAYLVEDNRVDQFVETARALDDEHPGLRLELTGPWPPYSFATVEERGF
ncbi:MAG: gas vesicle protein GvpFL, partial [Actinobacteria bacterium]